MTQSNRHDAWQAGDSYDAYMGRWSRQIAPRFLEWLALGDGLDWLDIGCGTGVLSAAILASHAPRSLISIDPSEGFLAAAKARLGNGRAVRFETGDAEMLTLDTASRDAAVSALVLNFVPGKEKALAEMKRVVRPGGTVGFYVWDYAGRGVEFMREFWDAAVTLDPNAADLVEDRRFAFCTRDGLTKLVESAGLAPTQCIGIECPTVFRDFEDYWHPFTLGAGPAPGYCAKLEPPARQRLKETLEERLPREADGSIRLMTRAWAVKAVTA